ncbi:TIMP4 [Mytilus edulis]|uniref:TIMP4 n=1 Tax=Mytilus edulis TaxID=6550 RepID=A0A8S3R738_MYTED|nr:TIMP4 [Mytilus edulis]
MEYDKLSDKKTLETPISTGACGPVVLTVGSSYILSVSLYAGKMSHNLCGLQVEAKKASQVLLQGLAGKYKDNCGCEMPYAFDPPPTGPQTRNQCRNSPPGCSYQSLCSRDGYVSEQCGCPAQYTQQVICDSKLAINIKLIKELPVATFTVVVAKIESSSSDRFNTNYKISVTKFYYGKMEYDKLSDKKTLETPISTGACGPVVLTMPYAFDPPPTGPQTRNQCRNSPPGCSYQSLCSRDGYGRCKWQGC